MKTGNLQAEKKCKARDVKVPLCPEQPHVHLHLSIQMGSMAVAICSHILIAVLSHLSDGICKRPSFSLVISKGLCDYGVNFNTCTYMYH